MKRVNITGKGIIKGIYTFLLTILITVLILLLSVAVSFFNDSVILRKVNESNYYNDIHRELSTKSEELIKKAGFPTSVLEDVITLERVYVDGKNYIEATLQGKEASIQAKRIREELHSKIEQYLKDEKIVITEDLKAGIEVMKAEIEGVYRQGIQLQIMNYIHAYKISYFRWLRVAIPIVIGLIGVLCFFLLWMSKYKHRGVRQISYAAMASSAILILSSGYLLIRKPYRNLEAAPDYYYDFLTTYFQWGNKVIFYMGFMGILVSIILISLVNYMKERMNSN
jgi:hypothetical protein